jgi:POT family proton-dependent oligopeptide transporter
MAIDTRASLEVTKGATVLEPIPLDTDTPSSILEDDQPLLGPFPTEEEWATLPRVAGSIPWTAWTVAAVEFVERFSYYGTSAVCKSRTHTIKVFSLLTFLIQS